jgi:hypothetical protein
MPLEPNPAARVEAPAPRRATVVQAKPGSPLDVTLVDGIPGEVNAPAVAGTVFEAPHDPDICAQARVAPDAMCDAIHAQDRTVQA